MCSTMMTEDTTPGWRQTMSLLRARGLGRTGIGKVPDNPGSDGMQTNGVSAGVACLVYVCELLVNPRMY